jgi:hypothetical protein
MAYAGMLLHQANSEGNAYAQMSSAMRLYTYAYIVRHEAGYGYVNYTARIDNFLAERINGSYIVGVGGAYEIVGT